MDFSLDSKQNQKFACSSCDFNLQSLRNCGGKFGVKKGSVMMVNGRRYFHCPRSLTFNLHIESYMASLYFDCRENHRLPFGQSMLDQTAYCKDLFDFLDSIVAKFRMKENDKGRVSGDKQTSKRKS